MEYNKRGRCGLTCVESANKRDYSSLLLKIILSCVIIAIVWTNLFHYAYKMNADIASEALLAREIYKSKEWIPSSWNASTEARIISMPNLAALCLGITESLSLAAGISCVLFSLGITRGGTS